MTSTKQWLAGWRLQDASVPWLLLVVATLSYGLLIPTLGFFWDDYPLSWIYDTFGEGGLERYFSTNRPYWGILFRFTMPLFAATPWAWHIFGLFWRWMSAVLVWLLLRRIWYKSPQAALWTSLLFLVYPGFQQQHIPIIYGHLFLVFCCFLLSLYINIWVMTTTSRWRWAGHALALALGLYQMLAMEYFFLLELIRPFLLWLVLGGGSLTSRERLKRSGVAWLPYLAVFFAALIWRAFFFNFQTENYQMVFFEAIQNDDAGILWRLLGNIGQSLWVVLVQAWGLVFRIPDFTTLGFKTTLVTAAVTVGGLILILTYLYIWHQGRKDALEEKPTWVMQAMSLGGVALLLGGVPSWLIEVLPSLIFALDRFTLPFILGVSLMLAGLIGWLPVRRRLQWALVGVLVSLAIAVQFQVANAARRDWTTQQRFFWQLAWRMPDLEPGTSLMVNDLPVRYYTDNSLTAPLNWYWAPDNQSQEMNFLLYYPHQRLGRSLEALEPGLALDEDYLAARFHGNTSQVVAIVFQPPACLRVLDAGVDYDNRMLSAELQAAALLSSSQWISIEGPDAVDRLPAALYGAEPVHGWCYYFSQAELARQQGDWEKVAELGDLAFSLDDKPNDPVERLVFIEGYAHTGDWNRAEELSRQALEITPMMDPLICHLWERIDREIPDSLEKTDSLEQVTSGLNCEG